MCENRTGVGIYNDTITFSGIKMEVKSWKWEKIGTKNVILAHL